MGEQVPPSQLGASSPAPSAQGALPPAPPGPAQWSRPVQIGVAAGLALIAIAVGFALGTVAVSWYSSGFGYAGLVPIFPALLLFTGGFRLLMYLLVGAGLVWLLVTVLSRPGQQAGGDSALQVLRQRYAKGEISEEEYRRMAEVLRRE